MARHLRITGRVQGVGYRASFAAQAQAMKLAGWVRNRQDGSVEAMIRGSPESVLGITDWAHRGPANAAVREVGVDEVDDSLVTDDCFEVLRTL
jgi:acylphosphatase